MFPCIKERFSRWSSALEIFTIMSGLARIHPEPVLFAYFMFQKSRRCLNIVQTLNLVTASCMKKTWQQFLTNIHLEIGIDDNILK